MTFATYFFGRLFFYARKIEYKITINTGMFYFEAYAFSIPFTYQRNCSVKHYLFQRGEFNEKV